MNREQLEEIRGRYEGHRGEIHDNEGRRVFCCDGCELAEAVPALLDEIERLTRELDTMREVAQGNKRHVAYLTAELERSGPVSLGTECLRCRHVYNWHSNANGWCSVVVDGQQCGCYFIAPTGSSARNRRARRCPARTTRTPTDT